MKGQRIGKRTQALSPASVSHQPYIQDHLGSIALVLDNSGNLLQKLSYDAWGLRRFPDGSEDPADSINAPDSRGYTDHEHLPGSRLCISLAGYEPVELVCKSQPGDYAKVRLWAWKFDWSGLAVWIRRGWKGA